MARARCQFLGSGHSSDHGPSDPAGNPTGGRGIDPRRRPGCGQPAFDVETPSDRNPVVPCREAPTNGNPGGSDGGAHLPAAGELGPRVLAPVQNEWCNRACFCCSAGNLFGRHRPRTRTGTNRHPVRGHRCPFCHHSGPPGVGGKAASSSGHHQGGDEAAGRGINRGKTNGRTAQSLMACSLGKVRSIGPIRRTFMRIGPSDPAHSECCRVATAPGPRRARQPRS